eukprot:Skav210343  [mRNA]  locus=scaffold4443:149976:151995:- [translate_table: standard]
MSAGQRRRLRPLLSRVSGKQSHPQYDVPYLHALKRQKVRKEKTDICELIRSLAPSPVTVGGRTLRSSKATVSEGGHDHSGEDHVLRNQLDLLPLLYFLETPSRLVRQKWTGDKDCSAELTTYAQDTQVQGAVGARVQRAMHTACQALKSAGIKEAANCPEILVCRALPGVDPRKAKMSQGVTQGLCMPMQCTQSMILMPYAQPQQLSQKYSPWE